ncbi:hypothetical protein Tco_1040187, partial [Tanacetum coccineum]
KMTSATQEEPSEIDTFYRLHTVTVYSKDPESSPEWMRDARGDGLAHHCRNQQRCPKAKAFATTYLPWRGSGNARSSASKLSIPHPMTRKAGCRFPVSLMMSTNSTRMLCSVDSGERPAGVAGVPRGCEERMVMIRGAEFFPSGKNLKMLLCRLYIKKNCRLFNPAKGQNYRGEKRWKSQTQRDLSLPTTCRWEKSPADFSPRQKNVLEDTAPVLPISLTKKYLGPTYLRLGDCRWGTFCHRAYPINFSPATFRWGYVSPATCRWRKGWNVAGESIEFVAHVSSDDTKKQEILDPSKKSGTGKPEEVGVAGFGAGWGVGRGGPGGLGGIIGGGGNTGRGGGWGGVGPGGQGSSGGAWGGGGSPGWLGGRAGMGGIPGLGGGGMGGGGPGFGGGGMGGGNPFRGMPGFGGGIGKKQENKQENKQEEVEKKQENGGKH